MISEERHCPICKDKVIGRKDKRFCSIDCKNEYYRLFKNHNKIHTARIDQFLHRNRTILVEVLGKNVTQKKLKRDILDKKGFRYGYITGFAINSKGKTYHHVYDFSWMEFSDDEILVIKKK